MKIKIFKSYLGITKDTELIQDSVNQFISNKEVIDIKQSISPRIDKDGETSAYFTVITVMYK